MSDTKEVSALAAATACIAAGVAFDMQFYGASVACAVVSFFGLTFSCFGGMKA